jgi:hypothetical protein
MVSPLPRRSAASWSRSRPGLKLKTYGVGRPGGKAGRGQLLAATAAELGAQRAAGILQHAVEQELEPGPGIPRLTARWAVQRKRVPVVP